MKTAMQELRDDLVETLKTGNKALNEIQDKSIRESCQKVVQLTLESIIKRIDEELLEMEKEQLLNMSLKSAHYERKWILEHSTESKYNPSKVEIRDLEKTALEHYNETFKQQEQL